MFFFKLTSIFCQRTVLWHLEQSVSENRDMKPGWTSPILHKDNWQCGRHNKVLKKVVVAMCVCVCEDTSSAPPWVPFAICLRRRSIFYDDDDNAKSCRHFIPDPIFFKGFFIIIGYIQYFKDVCVGCKGFHRRTTWHISFIAYFNVQEEEKIKWAPHISSKYKFKVHHKNFSLHFHWWKLYVL